MNRHSYIASMTVAGLLLGCTVGIVQAEEGTAQLTQKTNESIAAAESAIEVARTAIANGKKLMLLIPEDSELTGEVKQMIVAASANWKTAIAALNGAKESAAKIPTASNAAVAQDYALLSEVNAGVALSGAKVVQTALLYVDAVANNKTEALDIIRIAMQDSLAAASQVQFNYDRVKSLIADKYSK